MASGARWGTVAVSLAAAIAACGGDGASVPQGSAGAPMAGAGGSASGSGGSAAGGTSGPSGAGGTMAGAGGSDAGTGGAAPGGAGGTNAGAAGATGTGGAKACKSPLDCGDVASFVCDPETATCIPPQCDTTMPCKSGQVCVKQYDNVTVGVCRSRCALPAGKPCSASELCVPNEGAFNGFCYPKGAGAVGAPCDNDALTTGCATGDCTGPVGTPGVCEPFCSPHAADPGCPGTEICGSDGRCGLPATAIDPAAIGEPCATDGLWCGSTGKAVTGTCSTIHKVTVCRQVCDASKGASCPGGQLCWVVQMDASSGICMPPDSGPCQDGGSGSCDACVNAATAPSGCCANQQAACAQSPDCAALLSCEIACNKQIDCVNACRAAHPASTKLSDPAFFCLTGYGSLSAGACSYACAGPPVCGAFDGPGVKSCCTACSPPGCQLNGCYGAFYCNRDTCKCSSPSVACGSGGTGGTAGVGGAGGTGG